MAPGAGEAVLSWLEPRLEEVPPELAEAVREVARRGLEALEAADAAGSGAGDDGADDDAGDPAPDPGPGGMPAGIEPDRPAPEPLPDPGSVPDTLAWLAVRELDRVGDAPQDREAAVRLLAADACLTWAFEAAAERDEDLEGLADRSGLRGRIGRLLGRGGDGDA